MSSFDDLMKNLGVMPIKKNKQNITSHEEKRNNYSFIVDNSDEDEIFSKKNIENKKVVDDKVKKEDISNSFEEALKLYSPQLEENNLFHNDKANKKVFHERYSKIDEENIMHTIDLHGKTLDDAIALVKERLVWCYKEKFDYILIITGKGNHSDNGPVLKIGIKNLLINMSNLVELVEYAPKFLGGEGAYIVKIRL